MLRGVAQMQEHALVVLFGGEVLVAHMRAQQGGAGVIGQRIQPFVLHGRHIHLHQQIRPAAQIQPQMHPAPWHPWRRCCHEIGQAQQHPQQANADDGKGLGPAEIHHGEARGAPFKAGDMAGGGRKGQGR